MVRPYTRWRWRRRAVAKPAMALKHYLKKQYLIKSKWHENVARVMYWQLA